MVAMSGAAGRCQLFLATDTGTYTTTKLDDTSWNGWTQIHSNRSDRIAALYYGEKWYVAFRDASGALWRTEGTSGGTWTTPTELVSPSKQTTWADIAMTWDESARGFLVALPAPFSGELYTLPMFGADAWKTWSHFDTTLWWPAEVPDRPDPFPPPPRLERIHASRWMQDPPGITSPVIFGTDNYGNIYFIEYQRVIPPSGWELGWKSWYAATTSYTKLDAGRACLEHQDCVSLRCDNRAGAGCVHQDGTAPIGAFCTTHQQCSSQLCNVPSGRIAGTCTTTR